jgi:hypothetical protein
MLFFALYDGCTYPEKDEIMVIRNVKQDLANLSQQKVNDIRMSRLMKFAQAAQKHRELEDSYGSELYLNVPRVEQVRNLVAKVLESEASEVNGELPVISVFDAFQYVKAQKDLNKDAGLRALQGHLQRMWDNSLAERGPDEITAESFMKLKTHYARNYPKSRAAKVIEGFGKKGYATLNRNDLLRLASDIRSQEDFEQVVIDNGLQGGAPNQVKARKFILACVNSQEREVRYPFDQKKAQERNRLEGPIFGQKVPRREAQEVSNEDFEDSILDGMARALYVMAWASGMEEEGLTSNWGGMDLMDLAGETSPDAYTKAKELYRDIEQQNNIKLSEFTPPEEDYETYDRDNFGHYLAMEALGSGVGWSDDHEDHYLKLPLIEYGAWDDEQVEQEVEEAKRERSDEADFDKEGYRHPFDRKAQMIDEEGTIENIKTEGKHLVDTTIAPDDWARKIFEWLWENNQEVMYAENPNGKFYIDEGYIKGALEDFGWLDEDAD